MGWNRAFTGIVMAGLVAGLAGCSSDMTDTSKTTVDTALASPETGAVVYDIGLLSAQSKPDAAFKTVPAADSEGVIYGNNPLTVQFNNCQSRPTDEDDDLKFTYDFDGDGAVDAFGHCRWDNTYTAPAIAHVCVSDRRGNDVCRDWEIRPGSITAPPDPNNRPTASAPSGFISCPSFDSQISLLLTDPDGEAISWTATVTNGTLLSAASGGPVASGTRVNHTLRGNPGSAVVFRLTLVDAKGLPSIPTRALGPISLSVCGAGASIEFWY